MELNREEGEPSFLGRHIHLFQSVVQCHQEQALFHMSKTAGECNK